MKNKILKTLGTLVLGAGLSFNSFSQESIPVNLTLRDINGNYLGSMKVNWVMPLLKKYNPMPGMMEFDYDNQRRFIEEKGFYFKEDKETIDKIITIQYEYINEKTKIKKMIFDNNGNDVIDDGDEIREDNPVL